MQLGYRLLNVFCRDNGRLTGNPLCVFEDARGLSDEQMQALALQFNLSETTFILPAERAHARVRIFTPGYEMPFAGHPTLGTAHVVRALRNCGDAVTLLLNVGHVPVTAVGDRWELRANAAGTRKPQADAQALSAALGLRVGDVAGPALWVNSGSEQLIVPLASPDAVRRVHIDAFRLNEVTQDGPRAQAYVFADAGNDSLLARFFFARGGSVAEDPATGSAAANLGGWYLAHGANPPMARTISQGEFVGRPSTLRLRIDPERGVFVAGDVIELGGGCIEL